ncbi:hypothetical protein ANN_09693 [Periplaneta americana]|uniref:Sorting nexin-27 n=1 Tax=Periplaneta americana TaxID=6978 RepID=A0ABQ8TM28_PERAM|nr:hypothetical protein ANN_09693 [Periplaneta americana]
MSPGSSTESYPAFARVGLRENPGKNLNQVTCPDRESNPGHLVLQPDALTITPQVFNIYMAGRHLCSRRYREFSNLHLNLKKEFIGFNFPKLPGKWPFTLSEQQLDARRRGLEQYLEKVCAVRVIAESDVMQEFLTDADDEQGNVSPVDLKILLPDREVVTVTVRKSSTTEEVYAAVIDKIRMNKNTAKYFYLFEIVEYNFERKLQATEYPHNLYIQNYSTATSTCLAVRKWLFSLSRELSLASDDQATTFIFWQAVDDVNRGHIRADDRLYQLKALQDASRKNEYLRLARELTGYGEVVFPHCSCDSRKEGHVIASVGAASFKLQACREDGALESQVVEFSWTSVKEWEVDDEAMAFCFQYQRPEKNPRWVKIFTPYSQMLAGNEFQSLGRAIVKEDEYEEVRWDVISWQRAVDMIGGQVKRMAWMAAKSGKKIQSTTEFRNIVSYKNIQIVVQEVAQIEIDEGKKYLEKRFEHIAHIPVTLGVHYVKVLDPYVIEYAQLSCEQSVRKIHMFCV